VAVCSPIAGCSQDAWSEESVHELNISVSNAWKLSERSAPPPSAASKEQNQFIESIDEDGNTSLKKINSKELKSNDDFVKVFD
jgi:hypothetical protein